MKKPYQKFIRRTLLVALSLLLCWAVLVAVIDPFFHYHTPWFGMEPVVENERYQNPGMAEHFSYDSMILGSSMTENFRTGWFDEAFGCSSVKLPYSAARTGAYDWMLKKGFATRQMNKVFLGLDNDSLISAYGTYFFSLPEYLYDEDPFNDVEYLLDLSVLEAAWDQTAENCMGTVAPLEDAYVWDAPDLYGKEKALASVDWDLEKQAYQRDCSAFLNNCRENIEKNLLPHIQAHPETEFFIFFPPYSVLWWNKMENSGEQEARFEVARLAMELLIPCENVKFYYFHDLAEVVCDLDNYKDYNHYSAEISREMVDWMASGRGLVTESEIEERIARTRELVQSFDYSSLKN